MRQFEGTELGDEYRRQLAFRADGDISDVSAYQRTLGDLLDPARPGRIVDVVNAVTRHSGIDAGEWPINRVWSMLESIEVQAAQSGR